MAYVSWTSILKTVNDASLNCHLLIINELNIDKIMSKWLLEMENNDLPASAFSVRLLILFMMVYLRYVILAFSKAEVIVYILWMFV